MAENTTSSEPIGTDQQAKPVATERPKLSGGILVSSRQKGNPILKFVRNVPWEFTDSIVPGKLNFLRNVSCWIINLFIGKIEPVFSILQLQLF